MILLYQDSPVSVYGFNYQLGGLRRDLTQLKSENVLANTEETLSAMGYRYCLSLDKNETLLSLAAKPVTATLAQTAEPRALVFQHCHAESAVLPVEPGDTGWASRNHYFAATGTAGIETRPRALLLFLRQRLRRILVASGNRWRSSFQLRQACNPLRHGG